MALTATATQGFESYRNLDAEEILLIPGTAATTFTRGDAIKITNGVAAVASAGDAAIGVCTKSVTTPATSVAFPLPTGYQYGLEESPDSTLVPVQLFASAGTPLFQVTFQNHLDITVSAYSSATPSLTLGAGDKTGADDDLNGALVYVYEGPGIGEVNVITDYVNATGVCTLARKFATDLTASSKCIILGGETGVGSFGVGFFGRCDISSDGTKVDTDDGADNGPISVCIDYRETADFLKNLKLPVGRQINFG